MNPLMAHCPVCQALYIKGSVRLLAERPHVRLFHSMCPMCHHGMLAYVIDAPSGISSVGLITDISGEDALKQMNLEIISAEECIAVHRLILEQSRDICRQLLDISGKLA